MKLSLRALIAIPLIAQVVVVTAATGLLTYRHNRKAIQDAAYQILEETGEHFEHELTNYTDIPKLITQENLDALELEMLNSSNLKSWFPHLYRQIQRFPDVTYIYYGNSQGEYAEINRLPAGDLEFALKDSSISDRVTIYPISHDGRLESPQPKQVYDPRKRPWYTIALNYRRAQWTDVYDFEDPSPTLGISFVRPYSDDDSSLKGVLGADFSLKDLELFLTRDQPSQSSVSFLMEADGDVLASSRGFSSFINQPPSASPKRQQHQTLVNTTVDHILERREFQEQLQIEQQFRLRIQNQHYWVQVTPFSGSYDLRWYGISLLPEIDFIQQLRANNRDTILLCLLAMGLSSGASFVIARLISRPIQQLGLASRDIVTQDPAPRCVLPSSIYEINLLIENFNRMGSDLTQSRAQLKSYSQRLEELVDRRTRALQQSEETFSKAFCANPNAITLSTLREGRYLKVNDRFVELLGIAREEIIGRTSVELNIWIAPQTRDVFRERLSQGEMRNQEWRFRNALGEIKTVLLSAEVIHFQAESCVLVIANDIGDRIAAEEQLRQSEERWQLALKGNNDGIWDWNILTDEVFYSARWKSMLGYEENEIKSQKYEWENRLHPEDRERVLQATQAHLERKTSFFSEEYRLRCKDGRYKWILDRGQALWNAEGIPIRMTGSHTDISDRKQIEDELRRSQASLATAQRIAHVGNWGIDLTTHTAQWSQELLRMFGFDSNGPTPSYSQVFRRIHPDEQAAWKRRFRYALDTGIPQEIDFRIVLPSGEVRYIEGRVEGTQDSQGNVSRVFGTALEITVRKQAEATIQKQEQFLRSIYNSVATGIFVVDVLGPRKFRYIDSNTTAESISGSSKHALVNATPEELFSAETAVEIINKYQYCVDRKATLTFEEKLLINNQWQWWLTTLHPVPDDMGQIHQIIGTVFNITQQKTAEEALAQQVKNEQLLTSISNQIRQSLDAQKTYQTTVEQIGLAFGASRCCLHLYGDTPTPNITTVAEYLVPDYGSRWDTAVPLSNNSHIQTVLSQDIALVTDDITQEPLLATILHRWKHLHIKSMLAIRTSYQGQPNGVIEVHQCDRKRVWLQWEIELLESVATQVGIAIAQASLLTQEHAQRKALSQQNIVLENAMQAAEQANQVKGQFLANMSHELRTPLNAILGFAQLMQRNLRNNPKRFQQTSADHLQIIQNSSDHLLALINDILDMAKIEAGKVNLNIQPFDLPNLLQILVAMFQPKADAKELTLICEQTSDLPQYIETDEAKLRQILINLVGNAINFTQTGHVIIKVWFQQNLLYFAVEDTGQGIYPQELEHLFDAFYQTETGRQTQGGTGLGLAISQTYVNLLGGELTVSTTPHQGSTFQFQIPVTISEHAGCHESESNRTVVRLAPNQPNYRILVVEDKWASRTLLVQVLESAGFSVQEASNGKEAIRIWEKWHPHLIWMDMRMPIMNGYEATEYIRTHIQGQATAIIALTASALESEKQIVLSAGCNDFVRKPFQEKTIFEKLQQYLGVRYVYEQPTDTPLQSSENVAHMITPEQLSKQPHEWLVQLYSAASLADAEWVFQLIQDIPLANAPLTTALTKLVKGYRCDLIAEVAILCIEQQKP